MAKLKKGYATIYQREEPDPPGRPMSTHVDPSQINDEVPSEAKVKAVV